MAEITEIKRRLADHASEVAAYLLPSGKRDRDEWRVGSVGGEPGKSLAIHLSGQKAGIWADFASDDAGDLIDLWSRVRQVPLTTALDEIRDWLGIEKPQTYRPVPKSYARPMKPKCAVPKGRVLDYLTEDRNIPADIVTAYRIGEDGDEMVFPFLLPDGTLAMAKKRKAEGGAKPVPTAAGCEPVLFGWQALPPDTRHVVITEGEIDALSMAAYGYAALSVPYGGGGGNKQQWIESEYERMQRFEVIYLALDMDEPGEQAAQAIADRLGRYRCLRVTLPAKDANECLTSGVPKQAIDRAIADAVSYDPDGLALPSTFADDVTGLFWPQDGDHVGYRTPYGKLGDKLLFRPAELTIWTGASGAGKSQVLSDCTVDWIYQGARVCLSSLEMRPQQLLKRMVKQALATDRPAEPAIREALIWLDQGLILYTLTGKAKMDQLLDVFDYCRAKYGCDQFVIDSLMRLGIAGDDYNGQEGAIYRIVDWAIARSVHVHLVAHSRKGEKGQGAPETEDIKGAMEIGANAFNIVTVWRNRKLEEKIKAAETEQEKAEIDGKPPVLLNVAKQRNGDFEGKIGLWFNAETYQYASSHDRTNRVYAVRERLDESALDDPLGAMSA
jgi:twinkle protein